MPKPGKSYKEYKEAKRMKELSPIDVALLVGIGICLTAYIAGHFIGKPFPEMIELVKWFGVGLGLSAGGKVVSK